jgi:hypothetical protein
MISFPDRAVAAKGHLTIGFGACSAPLQAGIRGTPWCPPEGGRYNAGPRVASAGLKLRLSSSSMYNFASNHTELK